VQEGENVMPKVLRLSDDDVQSRLSSVREWQLRDNGLYRELAFHDFADAFSFMTSVAFVAERMSHHPEWSNVYNRLTIRLSTHDVGGLSDNDFAMAAEISRLFRRFE
jgi:4a-hydroxytetrahydrobiopterin dehydratase